MLFTIGCSKESDIELQDYNIMLYSENFSRITEDGVEFQLEGWKNYNEIGSEKWTGENYQGNGSAAFSAFQSGDVVNIGWLISPPINMDKQEGEKLTFKTQHNFLRSRENALELLVSTNFDGTNVSLADWINIPIKTPTPDMPRFTDVDSGIIDLSTYKGNLHFAFRVKGSGTISSLSGTYQIDDINLYYSSK